MIRLSSILKEQDTDFDKNRTEDPTSKPQEKLNVLFIGDGDTHSRFSYAYDILNSGIVTGNVVSTAEGDITKLLSLMQTNVADNYNVVSLMFSNTVPNDKVSAIEILKLMYSIAKDTGAKLITISPPTKDFAPYGHVKYASTHAIAEWMNSSQLADFNIDAYSLTNEKLLFQKNKILLNKEGHSAIAKQWLVYLNSLDSKIDANILDKKDAQKKQSGAETELKMFKKGDKSPKLSVLQRRLKSLEYPINNEETSSGQFGDTTYKSIRMFQLINEMPVTGYVDENTARAILNKDARSFTKWSSMFISSMPSFMKDIMGGKDDATTNISDVSTSVIVTSGDYKTSYSDDIATQTAAILRREEGMVLTPMWDVNNWRIGHGSSTITKEDGTVIKLSNNRSVKPNFSITAEDAERDLKRRLNAEFIPQTKRILGPIADKLNNGTLAALTSVCYNYGTVPNSVVQAARTGDVKNLANAVASLAIKSPIHKGRRNREASWILGSIGETISSTATSSTATAPTAGNFGKSIAIGDSLTPNVARAAGIQAASGLWKSGITIEGLLNNHVKQYAGSDPAVKNVVICIGTNGIFKTSANTVNELVKQLRAKFPNAKLLVVKGTYGPAATWSKPLTTVDQKTVNTYYSYFANNGVTVIPTAIGNQKDAHAYTDIYNVIGNEIKARLS